MLNVAGLMRSHCLPCRSLPEPTQLSLPDQLSSTLDRMSVDAAGRISDERVVKNGFRIRKTTDDGDNAYVMEGACADDAGLCGAAEVVQALEAVEAAPEAALGDCRPARVRAFLSGEAVRISRQSPPGLEEGEAGKMLVGMGMTEEKCLHGKPLTALIADLEEVEEQENQLEVEASQG